MNTATLTSSKQGVSNESKLLLFQLWENDKWSTNAEKQKEKGSLIKVMGCSDYNSPIHTFPDYSPAVHTFSDPTQPETMAILENKTISLQHSPRRWTSPRNIF